MHLKLEPLYKKKVLGIKPVDIRRNVFDIYRNSQLSRRYVF